MYYPIVKNKLNELKAIGITDSSKPFIPILELVETKADSQEKFFEKILAKLGSVPKNKSIFIDIPSYIENDVLEFFSLTNPQKRFDFFVQMDHYFKSNDCLGITPVISFQYPDKKKKDVQKETIKLTKLITSTFDKFAFRLFTDHYFKNEDSELMEQIWAFIGDEISDKCSIIVDCDKSTMQDAFTLACEMAEEYRIENLIISSESFPNGSRKSTELECDRVDNPALNRYKYFKEQIALKGLSVSSISYSDYTLLEKIQTKIEISEDQGFSYYPFINFTTEDGKMCKFTADERGKYHQYKTLTKRVISDVRNYSPEHCEACGFIHRVANDKEEKYKGGNVWKHRMISHHITTMAELLK